MLSVGDRVAGYRIEGVLGRGGMGVVFEATQMALQRRVALKILPAEVSSDEVFRKRFRREGILQAALDHPHIVTVYEAGEAGDSLFIAMRLIRGTTLKQLIRSAALDVDRALRVLGPVADALDAAHGAGLVHRDVKPHNVLVDERDHPYLADFGLTRTPDTPSLTGSGQFVGTPDYIAPEQIQGHAATAASDIYAFAAMLFECLTRSVPYGRETHAAVLWAHVHDPVPRVTAVRRDLPAALDAVIARGMAKEPRHRQQRATELVTEALEALGSSAAQPGVAAADLSTPTAPGTAARSRGGLGVALTVAAAAAGIAVLVLWGRDGGSDGELFTLGSPLRVPMRATFHCDNDDDSPCVVVQTRLPGFAVVAPRDGIVRRWHVKNATGTFRLVVLHRSGGRWTVVRRSDPVTVNARAIETLATSLPIHKGDAIGLDMDPRARVGWDDFAGADFARWTQLASAPQLPEGTGPAGFEMALAADVEP